MPKEHAKAGIADGERTQARPWDRLPGETVHAYRAFACYRDLGDSRTVAGAARALTRHRSLLDRWAVRHRWKERVWAWDLARARESEAAVRQEEQEAVNRRRRFADFLERLAIGLLTEHFRRDPETGRMPPRQPGLVRDAVLLGRHAIDLRRELPASSEPDGTEGTIEDSLRLRADPEITRLIERAVAEANANQEDRKDADQERRPPDNQTDRTGS